MGEIAQYLNDYGISFVLLAWMIYKDFKFNEQILTVLDKMNIILTRLETWHAAESGEQQ